MTSSNPGQILEVNYIVKSYYALPEDIDLKKEGVQWSINKYTKELQIVDDKGEKTTFEPCLFNDGLEDMDFKSSIHSKGEPSFDDKFDFIKHTLDTDDDNVDDDDDEEDEIEKRDIKIFILDGHEEWSYEGQMRRATVEDVEKWGEEYDLELGTFISVLRGFFSLAPLYQLLITESELHEMSDEGVVPRHLNDYYERIVQLNFPDDCDVSPP